MNVLVVIDMQNGAFNHLSDGQSAENIVKKAREIIENFNGKIYTTLHTDLLEESRESEVHLSYPKRIKGTKEWTLCAQIAKAVSGKCEMIEKETFGSIALAEKIVNLAQSHVIDEIRLLGFYTDTSVISNAILLKTALPSAKIIIEAAACAGTTTEAHSIALQGMKNCMIEVHSE